MTLNSNGLASFCEQLISQVLLVLSPKIKQIIREKKNKKLNFSIRRF